MSLTWILRPAMGMIPLVVPMVIDYRENRVRSWWNLPRYIIYIYIIIYIYSILYIYYYIFLLYTNYTVHMHIQSYTYINSKSHCPNGSLYHLHRTPAHRPHPPPKEDLCEARGSHGTHCGRALTTNILNWRLNICANIILYWQLNNIWLMYIYIFITILSTSMSGPSK